MVGERGGMDDISGFLSGGGGASYIIYNPKSFRRTPLHQVTYRHWRRSSISWSSTARAANSSRVGRSAWGCVLERWLDGSVGGCTCIMCVCMDDTLLCGQVQLVHANTPQAFSIPTTLLRRSFGLGNLHPFEGHRLLQVQTCDG